ncbi:hypothetical protein ACS0PU_012970 [Formica fusca]
MTAKSRQSWHRLRMTATKLNTRGSFEQRSHPVHLSTLRTLVRLNFADCCLGVLDNHDQFPDERERERKRERVLAQCILHFSNVSVAKKQKTSSNPIFFELFLNI